MSSEPISSTKLTSTFLTWPTFLRTGGLSSEPVSGKRTFFGIATIVAGVAALYFIPKYFGYGQKCLPTTPNNSENDSAIKDISKKVMQKPQEHAHAPPPF